MPEVISGPCCLRWVLQGMIRPCQAYLLQPLPQILYTGYWYLYDVEGILWLFHHSHKANHPEHFSTPDVWMYGNLPSVFYRTLALLDYCPALTPILISTGAGQRVPLTIFDLWVTGSFFFLSHFHFLLHFFLISFYLPSFRFRSN